MVLNNIPTILVADRDEEVKKFLITLFAKDGYRVRGVKFASEVIQKVQNGDINVLMMDIEISGMRGYEIIPIIKRIDHELPIITMSADTSVEMAKRVREEEVFFYAMKPLDPQEIKLVVKCALKRMKRKVLL